MKDNFSQFKAKLLHDIESGVVTVEPKWKTLVPKVLVGLLAIMAFLLTVIIFAYILFALRIAEHTLLLGFGFRGVGLFILAFPWHILALDIALVIAVVLLAKRFAFGWKTPRLYLLLGVLSAAFLAGVLVDKPLNNVMQKHQDTLPRPVGGLYHVPQESKHSLIRGTIEEIKSASIILKEGRTGESVEIVLKGSTKSQASELMVGDQVTVVGKKKKEIVEVFVIRVENKSTDQTVPLLK